MSTPKSVIHKKQNAINYNYVCEEVAAYILRIGKENGENNLADLFKNGYD